MTRKEKLELRDWLVNELERCIKNQWAKDTDDSMFHRYGGMVQAYSEVLKEVLRMEDKD